MPRIRHISVDHPLYEQEVDLRHRVLLEPIGLSMDWFKERFQGLEEQLEHFVVVIDHPKGPRVVGCVCLRANHPGPGSGQLMQLAVDPQRQKEGIGRALVAELERRAFGELGLQELFCHAMVSVQDFYTRMGWTISGEPFEEGGIPHVKLICQGSETDEKKGKGAA